MIVEKSHEIDILTKNYKSALSERDRHGQISGRLQSEMTRNSACLSEILHFINNNGKNYYEKSGHFFKNSVILPLHSRPNP